MTSISRTENTHTARLIAGVSCSVVGMGLALAVLANLKRISALSLPRRMISYSVGGGGVALTVAGLVLGGSVAAQSTPADREASLETSYEARLLLRANCAQVEMTGRSWTEWEEASMDDLQQAVQALRTAYNKLEHKRPQQGYSVKFCNGDVPTVHLQGHGGLRRQGDKELSNLPSEKEYKKECLFCLSNKRITPVKREEEAYTLWSRSGQLLLIPEQHVAHWFKASEEMQVSLLRQAYVLRRKVGAIGPLGLHCGEAGAQTVFHLHVRTNIHR